MFKKSLVLTSLFAALFVSGAVLSSQAASNPESNTRTEAPAKVAPTYEQAAALSCNQMSCHSNEDCGFPDVCGGCSKPAGQFFGHCLPTP
jgi:hypothetical protein